MWQVLVVILAIWPFAARSTDSATERRTTVPVTIQMTAKKYEFSPSPVTVTKGQPVKLEVTAMDKTHGIEIKEFKVKAKLEKGKMTVVEFTPDKAGEFEIKCSEFCGLGHGHMKGKLVVVDAK